MIRKATPGENESGRSEDHRADCPRLRGARYCSCGRELLDEDIARLRGWVYRHGMRFGESVEAWWPDGELALLDCDNAGGTAEPREMPFGYHGRWDVTGQLLEELLDDDVIEETAEVWIDPCAIVDAMAAAKPGERCAVIASCWYQRKMADPGSFPSKERTRESGTLPGPSPHAHDADAYLGLAPGRELPRETGDAVPLLREWYDANTSIDGAYAPDFLDEATPSMTREQWERARRVLAIPARPADGPPRDR